MASEILTIDTLRAAAEAYQDKLTVAAKLREKLERQTSEQKRLGEIDKRWAMFTNAQQLLAALQASEALQVLRDKVWQEGSVESGIGIWAQSMFIDEGQALGGVIAQAKLSSDPYPIPLIEGSGRNLWVRMIDERTELKVAVLLPTVDGKTFVHISEQGLHDINSLDHSQLSAREAIREHGLEGGLRNFTRRNYWEVGNLYLGKIDSSAEDAKDQLFYLLWQSAQTSQQKHNLPWEIRAWTKGMIGQLPLELQERSEIGSEALRHWSYRIIGDSRLGTAVLNFQDWVVSHLIPTH